VRVIARSQISRAILAVVAALVIELRPPHALSAQTGGALDPGLFRELQWRNIGPFRGGRTKAAAGIPSRPSVFLIGATNGGVWKTTDYGRTWAPIFDDQPTGSIGAIAIAPSNPDIIYVGSGEGLQRPDLSTGDGIYKSVDGGQSWTHLGLRDGQQIPQIVVDPRDPNRLFVAVLGHPYGPNEERGIFRSTDGGQNFTKVLYRDQDTGGADVVFDPSNANVVYAVLWQSRLAPWENGVFSGPGSGVFKSTDGGATWASIMNGLPTFAADGLGRVGITVAPNNANRLFATVEARARGGLYRSDNAGAAWYRVTDDARVTERESDFAEVKVDPKNADVVYTASVAAWKSTDGGKTFTAWRGAPGGDDYHRLWINPNDPDTMLLAGDQGAVISVNGGRTWSSWYNQPTAQFYHVSADNAFPYRVCGGQQESGSACVASRSDEGQIGVRDWHPVGVEEYGYVAPDPLDPDIVYGGRITRYDRRTGAVQEISPPRDRNFRVLRTAPVLFAPTDPHTLLFASNVLWKTLTGGQSWTAISPDLSRDQWQAPANVGVYRESAAAVPSRRGVIYAVAASPIDSNLIWAGTDDGLVHLTRTSGRTWNDVTPSQVVPWAKISMLEASHFDVNTAYAAVNMFRLDDLHPYVYRTRDGGRSWTAITEGLPDGASINSVKEDLQRRGLLFAATERSVYVSFDDGDHWQSLRLNMPATSVRDLVIKDDDLIAATHGRGFWILDDITPLRQLTPDVARTEAFLFRPGTAWRFRWNKNTDTPPPPDEPAAQNPPDGVVISYLLGPNVRGPVLLEIVESGSDFVLRRYSSDDPADTAIAPSNVPDYWARPARRLAATPGLHRFVWDVRLTPPPVDRFEYPIGAVPRNTPRVPAGIWAMPATYQLRLSVGGRLLRQAVAVKLDPRVKTPPADLALQYRLSRDVDTAIRQLADARRGANDRRSGASDRRPQWEAVAKKLDEAYAPLPELLSVLQGADARPTAATEAAARDALATVEGALTEFRSMSN
jgi:photosystem II stability/assembly factor-like uncharacterized protein